MKLNVIPSFVVIAIGFLSVVTVQADDTPVDQTSAYELTYQEHEPGVDSYEVRMLVSKRFLRVDETDDDSGYIIYDDKLKTIYSVSHFDKKILVIKSSAFSAKDSGVKSSVEYLQLTDAPKVSGKNMFNYRVHTGDKQSGETCSDIQLVEGLLPEVTAILKNYQQVISGQQVKLVKKTIKEVQTACYLVDQIYNDGLYYDKGLPIQEWHSNDKSRILLDYKKVMIKAHLFDLPAGYSRFSISEQ